MAVANNGHSSQSQRTLLVVANDPRKVTLEQLLRRYEQPILKDFQRIVGTSGSVKIARQIFGNRLQYAEKGHAAIGDAHLMSLIHTEVEHGNTIYALVLLSQTVPHQYLKDALLWTILECEQCVFWSTTAAYFELRETQLTAMA